MSLSLCLWKVSGGGQYVLSTIDLSGSSYGWEGEEGNGEVWINAALYGPSTYSAIPPNENLSLFLPDRLFIVRMESKCILFTGIYFLFFPRRQKVKESEVFTKLVVSFYLLKFLCLKQNLNLLSKSDSFSAFVSLKIWWNSKFPLKRDLFSIILKYIP